jgi:hypothetical protein
MASFLCNTSGSGKTRLLLEGLWRNWGLYFTASIRLGGLGSSDLEHVLQQLEQQDRLTKLTEENRILALDENRGAMSRLCILLLYVRLVALRIFLECASAQPGGITDAHKSRWLLLQIALKEFFSGVDIFSTLSWELRAAPLAYLRRAVESELKEVKALLGPSPPLFCVLDEAQVPTNLFINCFLSETEPTKRRPILREIVASWTKVLPDLIVSGTGVSMQEVESVLDSAVAKEGDLQSTTSTGAFDNQNDQKEYLKQYLPSGFLDSEPGKALVLRAGYWLCGR